MTEPTVPMQHPDWEQPAPSSAPTRPKRRRRRGTKWIIALVVLLGLLVGADRVALVVAEDQLASRIQSSQHLSQKPDVSISGFPFLTQVVARDFPHATVDIHGLKANTLTISDLHADLRGVHVDSGFKGATVDTLNATAELSYEDIGKALSSELKVEGVQVGTLQVSKAGADSVKATYQLLGVDLSATIDVTLSGPNTLEFRSASFKSPLSDLGIGPKDGLDIKYPLGSLPFGIELTGLTFTDSDVQIVAHGTHVDLSESATSGH